MQKINEKFSKPVRPERVIQFGEGGFLRGFADWMLQKMNDAGRFFGDAVVVQPIQQGMCDKLSAQDCLYTHLIRGTEGVEATVIDCISRCVKPYDDYDAYLALADQPEMRFIISNTTESGIAFCETDRLEDRPQSSFPAKLTALLYRRFQKGLPGFILLPCELIERNGDTLKSIVCKYARLWGLGQKFLDWLERENHFCNTLVDRIVTGYPKDEIVDLGYEDNMVNTSEYFHLWVIEGERELERELPFAECGLNVVWTDDLERYRTRKVRILNGAHTSFVPLGLLKGFDTVRSCVEDAEMLGFIRQCIYDEIIPTLTLPREELISYADNVLERFRNPYIKHYLSSIALNSVSKFRVRVLPSLIAYRDKFGRTPQGLLHALTALLLFYRTDGANDDPKVISFLRSHSFREILGNAQLWGQDLSFLADEVQHDADTSF